MGIEEAASYLLTDSQEYHGAGDRLDAILSHTTGDAAVEYALRDAGHQPAQQMLDYSGVTQGMESHVSDLMYYAMEACGMTDSKTRIFSQGVISPSDPESITSPDMLVVADPNIIDWDRLFKKIDFYERALKDQGVFVPVKYVGEDYVAVATDRPALTDFLISLLQDVPKVDVWQTPGGEVIPRDTQVHLLRQLSQDRRSILDELSAAESPEDKSRFAVEYFASRLKGDAQLLRPEGAEAVRIYPKQEVLKSMQAMGVEVSIIDLT